jgi:hypothetical protein
LARLLELSDRIEVLAAERAGALVELAEIRGVPLMQLMDELGIRMPGFEAEEEEVSDRRALLKLPLAERGRILKQQAEAALPYYEQDTEWKEWIDVDLIGINV